MRHARLAACLLLLVLAAGCAQAPGRLPLVRAVDKPPATVLAQTFTPPPPPPPPPAPAPPAQDTWPVVDRAVQVPGPPFQIAEVTAPVAAVFDGPTAPAPRLRLSNRTEHGFARVLLVVGQDGDRWRVLLPIRPNGAIGWIRAGDVQIESINTWIRVQLGAHLLTAGNGSDVIMNQPVAVGTGGTPTPTGTYYLLELIRPISQPYYGPFAYVTSAHSDVFKSFMGGDGTVGIHGTNAPGSIGRSVSHGCIRLDNPSITKLASVLPIGTPVFITP